VCREFLESEVAGFPPERPVYILGESFGAILAVAVAAARPDLVDRVILVNPATSYERSVWPAIGPLLPQVPKVSPLPVPAHFCCSCIWSRGAVAQCETVAPHQCGG